MQHDTSAEETEQVRQAVDTGDGGLHIPHQRVTHAEARLAGNYSADDLPNSVQITMANFSAGGSAPAASAVTVASRALPHAGNQYLVLDDPERFTKLEKARDSKLEPFLVAAAIISVTTLFTVLYTIRNPERVPNFIAQTVQISKQLFGRNSASAVQPTSVTAIDDVTRNTVVGDERPAPAASLKKVDHTAAQLDGSTGGAHQTLASNRTETGTRENISRHSPNSFLVPPPPPTPYVLPPAFGSFPMQPGQQLAADQQQLLQAQDQASSMADIEGAGREKTPHKQTAASSKTEAAQSAALIDADRELQTAVKSSLHTVSEWTR